jgi:hypothetical protein
MRGAKVNSRERAVTGCAGVGKGVEVRYLAWDRVSCPSPALAQCVALGLYRVKNPQTKKCRPSQVELEVHNNIVSK